MKKGVRANKKPSITTKVGKYFMAVQKGTPKKEAHAMAGYRPSNNIQGIENSSEYKALQEHFGTNLQKHITVNEINGYLADNIRQNDPTTGLPGRIDRNARNKAIEIAVELIAPKNATPNDGADKVLIVLSK